MIRVGFDDGMTREFAAEGFYHHQESRCFVLTAPPTDTDPNTTVAMLPDGNVLWVERAVGDDEKPAE